MKNEITFIMDEECLQIGDVIIFGGNHQQALIVDKDEDAYHPEYTAYPYKTSKNRIVRFFRLFWIKIRYKIIKAIRWIRRK